MVPDRIDPHAPADSIWSRDCAEQAALGANPAKI
jgi:hypothetical protein